MDCYSEYTRYQNNPDQYVIGNIPKCDILANFVDGYVKLSPTFVNIIYKSWKSISNLSYQDWISNLRDIWNIYFDRVVLCLDVRKVDFCIQMFSDFVDQFDPLEKGEKVNALEMVKDFLAYVFSCAVYLNRMDFVMLVLSTDVPLNITVDHVCYCQDVDMFHLLMNYDTFNNVSPTFSSPESFSVYPNHSMVHCALSWFTWDPNSTLNAFRNACRLGYPTHIEFLLQYDPSVLAKWCNLVTEKVEKAEKAEKGTEFKQFGKGRAFLYGRVGIETFDVFLRDDITKLWSLLHQHSQKVHYEMPLWFYQCQYGYDIPWDDWSMYDIVLESALLNTGHYQQMSKWELEYFFTPRTLCNSHLRTTQRILELLIVYCVKEITFDWYVRCPAARNQITEVINNNNDLVDQTLKRQIDLWIQSEHFLHELKIIRGYKSTYEAVDKYLESAKDIIPSEYLVSLREKRMSTALDVLLNR